MDPFQESIAKTDADILRDLAKRQLEIAHDPIMDERRRLWRLNNDLHGERPMVLAETVDLMRSGELLASTPLRCVGALARIIEGMIRATIFSYETVQDDSVVDPWINWMWSIGIGNYGVEIGETHSPNSTIAVHYDSPLRNLGQDLCKLKHRTFSVDHASTHKQREILENILGDILPVRIHSIVWPLWTMGMTWDAIKLVGMENLMLSMMDDPDAVHRLMDFLCDDFLSFADWMEKQGLLSLNNDNDYIGSGSRGFTLDLPQKDYKAGTPVRLRDLWVLLESQETVGISPDMFEEFVFPYQRKIADRFGLVYYGCCEPINTRWHVVQHLRNLRSVSISPWCDQEFMADALGRNFVFSRKPNPMHISGATFDEEALRADVRHTLQVAHDCNVEIILKDVHTVSRQPDRLGSWVRMVREEIIRSWGS